MEAIPLNDYIAALERKRDNFLALAADDNKGRFLASKVQEELARTAEAALRAFNQSVETGGEGSARIEPPGKPRQGVRVDRRRVAL